MDVSRCRVLFLDGDESMIDVEVNATSLFEAVAMAVGETRYTRRYSPSPRRESSSCANCRRVLSSGDRFCPQCGVQFGIAADEGEPLRGFAVFPTLTRAKVSEELELPYRACVMDSVHLC